MQVEKIFACIQALPNRDAELALLEFRALPEAWDVCINILAGAHGSVPQSLGIFACQTLHAAARRVSFTLDRVQEDGAEQAQVLASRQQGLLAVLCHISRSEACHNQQHVLFSAALGALSIRNLGSLRDFLSAALQQLSTTTAIQLLTAVAEEAEAIQARLGGDVEPGAALQHVLREEVGHHVLVWLAGVAATAQHSPAAAADQNCHQHTALSDQHGYGQGSPPAVAVGHALATLLRGVARCFGAWVRLGCLHGACCAPVTVQSLVDLLLRAAHPGDVLAEVANQGAACGGVTQSSGTHHDHLHHLRHEACEALADVIEYGPDVLVRALHVPMMQLHSAAAAAAPDAAAAAETVAATSWGSAVSSCGAAASGAQPYGGRITTEAVYDVVQVVSSYAAARQSDWVAAWCSLGTGNGVGGGAGSSGPSSLGSPATINAPPVTDAAEAVAVLEGLARLAALPALTDDSYPVSYPAHQALTDLALACIATCPVAAIFDDGAGHETTAAWATGGHGGVCAARGDDDAMQQDDEAAARAHDGNGYGRNTYVAGSASSGPDVLPGTGGTAATGQEGHCVPDVTLHPRPGLPAPLVVLYDSVLRGVLSCCVTWSMSDAEQGGGAGGRDIGNGGLDEAEGLLRLPLECREGLRDCLQACAGVVGQARQLATAAALLQQAAEGLSSSSPGGAAGQPHPALAQPSRPACSGTDRMLPAAALTAALAAVASCGTLPDPQGPNSAAACDLTGHLGADPRQPGSLDAFMSPQEDPPGTAPAASCGGGGVGGLAGSEAAAAAAAVVLSAARFILGGATAIAPEPQPPPCGQGLGPVPGPLSSLSSRATLAARGQAPQLVPLWLHFCEAVTGSCRAVLRHAALQASAEARGQQGGGGNAKATAGAAADRNAGQAAVAALCDMAGASLAGLRAQSSAGAASRALASLVASAEALRLPLPAPMAERLVDAVHSLPYDAGPHYQAAVPDLLRAAVGALRLAGPGPGEYVPATQVRLALLHRLLAPSLACIAQATAAAATAPMTPGPQLHSRVNPPKWTRVPGHVDAALNRQLQLLEILLNCWPEPAPTPASPPALGAAPAGASGAYAADIEAQEAEHLRALPRRVFVEQVWPQLQALLLQRGAAGRFLLPMCRSLKRLLLLRAGGAHLDGGTEITVVPSGRAAGSLTGAPLTLRSACDLGLRAVDAGGGGAMTVDSMTVDPWVASVLSALAACVGRPGARHVNEPLVALLEVCAAGDGEAARGAEAQVHSRYDSLPYAQSAGFDNVGPLVQQGSFGAGAGPNMQSQPRQREQVLFRLRRRQWRVVHARLAANTVYMLLCGGATAAAALAATWRSADRDPETAECLLRLAAAAARHLLAESPDEAAAGITNPGFAPDAAGSTGSAVGSGDPSGAGGAASGTWRAALGVASLRLAAAASGCDHRQVATAALGCTCAVLEAACGGPGADPASGPLDCARRELIGGLMQQGPVVAAGLLDALLSSSPLPRLQKVAAGLMLLAKALALCYLDQQLQQQRQQQHSPEGVLSAGVETCGQVLSSWLAVAAAQLQLSEHDGAMLCRAWVPVLVECGLCMAAEAVGLQGPSVGLRARSGSSPSVQLRMQQRKLRRLLREFAEQRLRV